MYLYLYIYIYLHYMYGMYVYIYIYVQATMDLIPCASLLLFNVKRCPNIWPRRISWEYSRSKLAMSLVELLVCMIIPKVCPFVKFIALRWGCKKLGPRLVVDCLVGYFGFRFDSKGQIWIHVPLLRVPGFSPKDSSQKLVILMMY